LAGVNKHDFNFVDDEFAQFFTAPGRDCFEGGCMRGCPVEMSNRGVRYIGEVRNAGDGGELEKTLVK